jgi:hypothetical protein
MLVLVAGCDLFQPEVPEDAPREASGEVLEGSISDAMLPLGDLSSQPPAAAPLPGESTAAPAGAGEAGETPAAGTEAAGEPAAEASPAVEAEAEAEAE